MMIVVSFILLLFSFAMGNVKYADAALILNTAKLINWTEVRSRTEKTCFFDRSSAQDNVRLSKECNIFYFHLVSLQLLKFKIHDSINYINGQHKTGGSTMCSSAYQNGYVKDKVDNCNIPRTILDSRSYEKDYFNEQTRFGAAEFGQSLIGHVNSASAKTIYVMTMRNPIDRIVSHVNYAFCGKRDSSVEPCFASRYDKPLAGIVLNDMCMRNSSYYDIVYGNFYVSRLTGCGRDCTEVHLHEAIRFFDLLSFLIISDTEELYER